MVPYFKVWVPSRGRQHQSHEKFCAEDISLYLCYLNNPAVRTFSSYQSNGRRPKWKTTQMEDDPKWKMTKMEDDQNGRQTKWKTTKMEDDKNGRQPKWINTKIEDDQNGR